MKSHWLAVSALVLGGAGCETAANLKPGTNYPAFASAKVSMEQVPSPAGALARLQKPEGGSEIQQTSATATATIPGEVTDRVLATVNGVAILADELKQAAAFPLGQAAQLSEPERSARIREIISAELDKLIERELIMKEAQSVMEKNPRAWQKLQEYAGKEFDKTVVKYKKALAEQGHPCANDEEFKERLAMQGLTIEGLKRQIERGFMAMEYMRHKIFPIVERMGHKEIRDYYDQHPGEFQLEDRVHWQDIFIDATKEPHPTRESARRFAEEVARAARMGDDFARLCDMYDDGDSKPRKGDGYGAKRGEIRPVEVERYLFQMQNGEVGPIVELSSGFHVIRLVERQFAGPQPFDDKTQAQIKRKLQGVILEREYKRQVGEMKRRAVILIVENEL
jgi:parvulin-like peptidyl-prolyl isomerase